MEIKHPSGYTQNLTIENLQAINEQMHQDILKMEAKQELIEDDIKKLTSIVP